MVGFKPGVNNENGNDETVEKLKHLGRQQIKKQ